MLQDAFSELEDRAKGIRKGMMSGLRILDSKTAGFHKGEMTIIGARPAVGKSAFAKTINPVDFFMSGETAVTSSASDLIDAADKLFAREKDIWEFFTTVAYSTLPGGTTLKRANTGIKSVKQGYAESAKGKVLLNYNPDDEDLKEYKLAIDYALQRIEAYAAERLYENKGSTKGTEFLLQNTLGYANKSDVNSKQELEVTEKVRIKQLSDEEVKSRLARLTPKIVQITDINKAEAQ